jgi:hypothetical protein
VAPVRARCQAARVTRVGTLGEIVIDVTGLGATFVGDPVREADCRFQVLTDPGGNELCLVEMR